MDNKAFREHISKVVKPIFNKFLQEKISNSMTPPHSFINKFILFRPNNYRRICTIFINEVKKQKLLTTLNTTLFKGNTQISKEFELKNITFSKSNKLINIYLTNHIILQIGKDKITGIYNQLENKKKVVFKIKGKTDNEIAENLEKKSYEVVQTIDRAIKDFCNKFKIRTDFSSTYGRMEMMIKHDDFIDNLPKDMIIHDTIFKKVYDKGVEFKSGKNEDGIVHAKNYINNRAVDIPKIEVKISTLSDNMNTMAENMKKQSENILFLAQNVNMHVPMIKKLGDNADRLGNEVVNLTDAVRELKYSNLKPVKRNLKLREYTG